MTVLGSLIGTGISGYTLYYTAYKLGWSLYPVIWTGIAVWTVWRLVAKNVSFLDMSLPSGQPWYYVVPEMLIGLIPLYLFYTKFGITGLIVSFVLNLVFGIFSTLVLKI